MTRRSIDLAAAQLKLAALMRAQSRLREAAAELQRTLHTAHPEAAISDAIERIEVQCTGQRALINRIEIVGR